MQIYDNTDLDEFARSGQTIEDCFGAILHETRARLRGVTAVTSPAITPVVTIADGEIKREGESGHSYVIDIPMTVERQVDAVRKGADASVAAIEAMPGDLLVWYDPPQVGRWLAPDGLHITVRMRIAKL